jgi:hypothetical protein
MNELVPYLDTYAKCAARSTSLVKMAEILMRSSEDQSHKLEVLLKEQRCRNNYLDYIRMLELDKLRAELAYCKSEHLVWYERMVHNRIREMS